MSAAEKHKEFGNLDAAGLRQDNPSNSPVQCVVVQNGSSTKEAADLGDTLKNVWKKLFPDNEKDPPRSPTEISPPPGPISVINAYLPGILLRLILLAILVFGCILGVKAIPGVEKWSKPSPGEAGSLQQPSQADVTASQKAVEASVKSTVEAITPVLKDLVDKLKPAPSRETNGTNFDPRIYPVLADIERAVRDNAQQKIAAPAYIPIPMQATPATPQSPISGTVAAVDGFVPATFRLSVRPCPYKEDSFPNTYCNDSTLSSTPNTANQDTNNERKGSSVTSAASGTDSKSYPIVLNTKKTDLSLNIEIINAGSENLSLLGMKGYLSSTFINPGAESLDSSCKDRASLTTDTLILHNTIYDWPLVVGLDRGLNKKALRIQLQTRKFYLLLCTSYRAYHQTATITNESVYELIDDNNNKESTDQDSLKRKLMLNTEAVFDNNSVSLQ